MERLKVHTLQTARVSYNAHCTLDEHCLQDLDWWCRNLPGAEAPISRGYATRVMTTDASEKGWSAVLDGAKAHGRFAVPEQGFPLTLKKPLPYILV